MSRTPSRGFTLIELVITVTIVAILAAIAYPSYLAQTQKSRRADALSSETAMSSSLERCYAQAYTYTGCAAVPAGAAPSSQGYYTITTTVTFNSYTLTANPTGAQASDTTCANIVLSNTGQSATNSLGTDVTKTCWGST
jgi:type IV pilus assembly protein PilE